MEQLSIREAAPVRKKLRDLHVYLCGGINGLNDAECNDWREEATGRLIVPVLNPMRRDYRGTEDNFVNEIVEGDLEDVRNSDLVLVNAVRPSWGTAMEVFYAAHDLHIPVVGVFPGGEPRLASPWLLKHARLTPSLDSAIKALNYMILCYQATGSFFDIPEFLLIKDAPKP